jgi:topoisomerase-4 subunit A
MDAACAHIDERLTPFYPQFVREVTKEDILRLMEIKMARILKFNKDKADELIARMKAEIERIDQDLANMVEVTCNWFRLIRDKYAADHPRRTEIRSFDTIEATKVIEANEKLYINRVDGFIGTSLKKDEFVANCSPIDDVILFYRDGTYKITRVQEKVFVGETERSKKEKKKAEIIHVAVFKRNDKRTIYNVVYRDGKAGAFFIKRFYVTAITHDREYDLTTGEPGSRVVYFTENLNGEAELIKVTFKPNPRLRRIYFEKDFGEILVKGRASRGNLLTKLDVHKITLKAHGGSTLGGRKVWFDHDVARLNYDERGQYLGEFHSDDAILVILKNGDFYTTNFDLNNHYEPDLLRIEKFDENKVWSAVLFDADQQGFPYVKRFLLERTSGTRRLNFMGENPKSQFVLLSDEVYPRLQLIYGGADAFREPLEVDVETYIGVKSFKAKGKRLTTCAVERIEELTPLRYPEPEDPIEEVAEDDSVVDDENPQLSLF